jgi:hypothetical protein
MVTGAFGSPFERGGLAPSWGEPGLLLLLLLPEEVVDESDVVCFGARFISRAATTIALQRTKAMMAKGR